MLRLSNVDGSSLFANQSGSLNLPAVTNVHDVALHAGGWGGSIDLPSLVSFTGSNSSITVGDGGAVTLNGQRVSMPTSASAGASIYVPQLGFNVPVDLSSSGVFDGVALHIGQGDAVYLASGTFTGETTFDVADGATLDLTDGKLIAYAGTLGGSGEGTVQLSSGRMTVGTAGLTLNFPDKMFQWTGGGFDTSSGNVTNQDAITLAGDAAKGFYGAGSLDDYGVIDQTGAGNLTLHSYNDTPATLKIEPGGVYVLESDSGIDSRYGGPTALQNAGAIVKTSGSGKSTLSIQGSINNTGLIEVDSGTLFLDSGTLSQVSHNALTGGTWKAAHRLNARIPHRHDRFQQSSESHAGRQGAEIVGLAALAANSGSVNITNGAGLMTNGNFSNSGKLTLGPGGKLAVGGSFTQTAAGTLNEQLGGTPASGQFGQADVQQQANLAGALNVELVNSFTPNNDQSFEALVYAGVQGNFTSFAGLQPYFTERYLQPCVDDRRF